MLHSVSKPCKNYLLIAVETLWLIGKTKMVGTTSIFKYRLWLEFLNLLKLNVESAAKYDNETQLHSLPCKLKSG